MRPDELADVIPLGVTISITDGVQEMKFGKRICDIQGYGENGWTNESMLDYFTDLCRVYDAWVESKKPWQLPVSYEDLVLPDGIRNSGWNTCQELCDFVSKCYEHYQVRLVPLLDKLGVPIMDWYQSVCNGREPTAVLTAEGLTAIEDFYVAVKPEGSMLELMKVTGLTRHPIETLGRLFAKKRIMVHGETALRVDRAPQMLRHLVAQGQHKNNECLRIVAEATGVMFSKSYVSKIRQEIGNKPLA